MKIRLALALGAAFITSATFAQDDSKLPLRAVKDVPLEGKATRLDYQSFDEKTNLLFVAHLGDGVVHVYDAKAEKIVKVIKDVSSVHGVLVVSELGRCYASATGKNEIVSIDEKTLEITDRIPSGDYPDGLAYDPVTKKLFVSDENGKTVTVIDTKTQKRVATIEVGGEVGNTQYDSVSKHMFSCIQTKNDIVEIDPEKNEIVSRIPVEGDGNHGLYIDSGRRLAFAACQGDSKLVVIDLETKKTKKTFSIGRGNDVLAFDPGLRWLYVSSESGVVSIFEVGAADDAKNQDVKKVAEGFLAANAHTVAVDPSTHRVFFALKSVDGKPVLRVYEPTKGGKKKDDDGDGEDGDEEGASSDIDQLQAAAVKSIQAKKYDRALEQLESVLDLVSKSKLDADTKKQNRQIAHYNMACALSLQEKKKEAVAAFAKAVELGFHDWEQIDGDADLDNIRDDPAFKKVIEKAKGGSKREDF